MRFTLWVPARFWNDHAERCPSDSGEAGICTEVRESGRRVLIEGDAGQVQALYSDAAFYCDAAGPDECPPGLVRSARATMEAIEKARATWPPHATPIAAPGRYPAFPRAERVSPSDAKLYAFGAVPILDEAEEDYVMMLTVHTADPGQERALADHVTGAVNAVPEVLEALKSAHRLLNSVAFVSTQGDTGEPLRKLAAAIERLGGST